jgi:phenylacetic acid degradation operon negative regulatory protein
VEREDELALAIDDEPAAGARSFIAETGSIGDPAQLVADAWDLHRVREQYTAFLDDFTRVRAPTPEACFRQQTLLVHAWRKFPFLDPDLPAALLPPGSARTTCSSAVTTGGRPGRSSTSSSSRTGSGSGTSERPRCARERAPELD